MLSKRFMAFCLNSIFLFLTGLNVLAANPLETLDGHWITECQNGKISEMRIDRTNSYLREAYYQESTCKTLLFFFETQGIVSYPDTDTDPSPKNSMPPEFYSVDYTYSAIELTPLTGEMAEQFNHSHLCGLERWKALIPQAISGLTCRLVEGARPIQIPAARQQRFGIFKVREPWLYFGQNNQLEDSSTPSRRPQVLQTIPFGKRYVP